MLKKYASYVNIIAIVFAALAAIAGIYSGIETESIWPVLYTVIPAIVFYIFAKAFSELLYATAENQESIQKVVDILGKNENAKPIPSEQKTRIAPASEKSNVHVGTTSYSVDASNSDYIVCTNCGTRQRSNRARCLECGAYFEK